jgi:tetratricopeptide (TPR) repeat protein
MYRAMDIDEVKQLLAKGQALFNKGKWAEACKELSKAKSALERMKLDSDGKTILSQVLQLKAFAETRRGQYRIAIQAAERSLEISRSVGDQEGEADALRTLGYIHWLKGDLSVASDLLDDALVKAKECNANVLIGKIKIEQGNVIATRWQYDEAMDLYREAAKILKHENSLPDLSRAYNNLGFMLLRQKKHKEAITALKTAMDLADQSGDVRIKNMAAINAAECFVMLGSLDVATEMLGPATDAMIEFDDKAGIASTYRLYGMIYTMTKKWPKAETYFRKACALVKVVGNPEMEGAISKEYGRMFIEKGDKERARVKLSEAFEIFKKLGVKDKAAEVQQILRQTQD